MNLIQNKTKHESITAKTTKTATTTNVVQTHTGVTAQDANHVQQRLNSGDNLQQEQERQCMNNALRNFGNVPKNGFQFDYIT